MKMKTKSALAFVLFRLFTIGVFVDGEETVSVMEGDSVSLKSGVTDIKTVKGIEWRLNGNRIVKISSTSGDIWGTLEESFKSRLQLDNQTGDLKISNIRPTDSGEYKVKVSSTIRSPPEMTLTVSVVSDDEVKTVSVMKGANVTLHTGLTEIQTDDEIRWRFGQLEFPIAEINRAAGIFKTYDGLHERFRGRLKLDQTGSLTITNITDSGRYEADITRTSSRYTVHKTFNVTVRDDVRSVLEGDNVTLYTGLTGTEKIEQILWKFGDNDELIAALKGPVNDTWSNIYLNRQTGDITIKNFRNNQYGYYKVEINTSKKILHMKFDIAGIDVLVMEGDSVTLHTGFTIIQKKHGVLWYDDKDNLITQSNDINDTTGDLTIRNIRRHQSGDYKVQISNSSGIVLRRIFPINISDVFSNETDGVKTVLVKNGDSFSLQSNVDEIQNDVSIEWIFGSQNLSIAKTDGKNNKTSYNNDTIFKNKLYLDIKSGDLNIINSSTEHSGRYQLKIINSVYTVQKSFRVTVSAVSGSGLSPGVIAGIVVGVVLLVAAVIVVIYKCCCSKKPKLILENPSNVELLDGNGTESKPTETEEQ